MKQNKLSEMVDRIIESITKVQKADELVLQQECIDIQDDVRRDNFRKSLKSLLHKLEKQMTDVGAIKTLNEIYLFLYEQYRIEDSYENADDELRNLNIKKLDEALEELRKACREFELRSIEEVKDMRSKDVIRNKDYSNCNEKELKEHWLAIRKEVQKKKSSHSSGNLNNCENRNTYNLTIN